MGRRAFTHKGLFQAVCRHFYMAGSDVKAISVAVLCGDAEWPQEMGPFSDSRALEPDSTHGQMPIAVVLSGKKEDLFFPTKAQCLFFT